MKESNSEIFDNLTLARKIEANAHYPNYARYPDRNVFYFSSREQAKKVTEEGKRQMRKFLKLFNLK